MAAPASRLALIFRACASRLPECAPRRSDIERATYTDFMGTARALLAEQGIGRFFNGWAFRTTRMICAIWLIGQCKNLFGYRLFPHAAKKDES